MENFGVLIFEGKQYTIDLDKPTEFGVKSENNNFLFNGKNYLLVDVSKLNLCSIGNGITTDFTTPISVKHELKGEVGDMGSWNITQQPKFSTDFTQNDKNVTAVFDTDGN
jgi:hypothetical protein